MRKYLSGLMVLVLVFVFGFAANSMAAAAQDWEQEFIRTLTEARNAAVSGEEEEGLGYTPSEEKVLEDAIKKALNQGGPGCQIMKIAMGMDYNPYLVLVNIYSFGDKVKLDEICMCSTEQGVDEAVIAKAAADATAPDGSKVYTRDEVAQCQCLQPGLPYTPAAPEAPPQPEPPDPVPPVSVSAP
ncbi:MAG: hypothetical protein K9J85_10500 [Desulfobacteraceae bacterium]|nr:hypothetical protein [Desulfobacteraceae bacterium]